MAKIRKIGQSLTTKDWMKYRPYTSFSNYDAYYLKLAKKVFAHFNQPKGPFRQVFQRDDLKEIAIIVTCHFEDFISEIGLWQALVRKHEELYGRALPFYDLEDYERDYLNPQDFAYLLWHQLGKLTQKSLDPFGAPLLIAADFCYELFESRIDEAPATDFYDNWLSISDDTYFFDLKQRLIWMAFKNYLFGPELNLDLDQRIGKFFEAENEFPEHFDPGSLIYALQEDVLMTKCTSFCGLTVADWLAETGRCPEALRTDIRRLFQRVQGIFLYEGHDEQHYHFQFVPSGRSFAIHRDSVELDLSRIKAGTNLAFFGIVNWQNEWWLSGSYMEWDHTRKNLEEIRLDPQYANFYGWTEAQQQQIRDLTEEMESAFISYFGKRLVFFPNEQTMATAMEGQNKWWNTQKAKKPDPEAPDSRYAKLYKERSSGFEDLDLGGGSVAVFFTPGEGVLMSGRIPHIIEQLQQDSLSLEDSRDLFYAFFHECEPPLAQYIAENYPTRNLKFPMSSKADFTQQYFDFFLRYYQPENFSERLPKLSLLPEDGR